MGLPVIFPGDDAESGHGPVSERHEVLAVAPFLLELAFVVADHEPLAFVFVIERVVVVGMDDDSVVVFVHDLVEMVETWLCLVTDLVEGGSSPHGVQNLGQYSGLHSEVVVVGGEAGSVGQSVDHIQVEPVEQ